MSKYDIIVLGSGPGGYVTAIRASQLGFKTAVIEKENLGGVCLNWGCIPTKALLKSAQVFDYLNHAEDYGLSLQNPDKNFTKVVERSRSIADGMSKGVQFLMKKNKIDVIDGYGTLKPGKKVDVDGTVYSADHIIIATGAKSRQLANLPQDGEKVIGYREAMTLKKQPKSMIVVGSGAIGVEFAHFYNAMGTDVTIVATGHLVWKAKLAIDQLADKGISAELLNIHTIKPLDEEAILASVAKTGCIVTAEEHQINGGLGESVAGVLARNNPKPIEMVAVNDTFGESGTPDQLMTKYGLDTSNIIAKVEAVLARK